LSSVGTKVMRTAFFHSTLIFEFVIESTNAMALL
jgi:hypothetical protein